MEQEIAFQIVDHAHAIAFIVARLIQQNRLPADSNVKTLKWHLHRTNMLLDEIAHPLTRNPIVTKRIVTRIKSNKPNEDETLPSVKPFGWIWL